MEKKAHTVKIDVTASTREYKDANGKPLTKTMQFSFPIYDEKLENLVTFFDNDPEQVYDIVYAAKKIEYQAECRRQLEAEQAGDGEATGGSRRVDPNMSKLKGKK